MVSLLLLALPLGAAPWLRIQTAPFEVYTDAGEGAANRTAARLQEIRRILALQWPESPLPIRVLVLSSAQEYTALRPAQSARAFFQSGPERDYIIAHAGDNDTLRAASHEYVHVVLHHTTVKLPLWLEEGLADFFSTAVAVDGKARLGLPVEGHVSALSRHNWLDAETLAAVNRKSTEYNDLRYAGVFYAESWALVHMLMVEPPWSVAMPGFLNRLSQGTPFDAAFGSAFGKSIGDAVAALHGYIGRSHFDVLQMDLANSPEPSSLPPAETVPGARGRTVAAEVATLAGRLELAESIYKQIAGEFPDSPAAESGLASLAMQTSDYETARKHLARAMDLGARDASTYFEYAMLVRETHGSRSEVREYLEKAVSANPRHPEAQFLLGQFAESAGRRDDAIRHYKAAVEVLPRQSSFWHALAMAYLAANNHDEARRAAQNALDSATLPHERSMAEAALKAASAAIPATPSRPGSPGVVVPETWKGRKAAHSVTGRLIEVECRPDGLLFHIAPAGGTPVLLTAKRPNDIELHNSTEANREFHCGPQKDVTVTAGYSADNDLVTLEFLP